MKMVFKGIAIVCLVFIIWIIYSADSGKQNVFFNITDMIPFGDKIGHFFLFGILTLVVNIALQFKQFKYWQKVPLGTLLVLVFVILEELSQGYFPNRTFDIMDLIADGLGILTFTYLGNLLVTNGVVDLQETE
ncbi:VanZ family protein [Winogradskyella psychrotolerans]|uniref:VanZ family protein n=1 Tax=Winogradskyella psychrotolerans TaxID=1344585 RepID=UPI001C06907A|nr:VanZ family protein [Winogradskyella psychrotolerans]MBU2930035.1 VanZ family protein [Winogradskyella psychrotolerans]